MIGIAVVGSGGCGRNSAKLLRNSMLLQGRVDVEPLFNAAAVCEAVDTSAVEGRPVTAARP